MKRSTKYVALDVHQATTIASVREESGRVIARTILPTEAPTLIEFFRGMRGAIHVAFEEGTQVRCSALDVVLTQFLRYIAQPHHRLEYVPLPVEKQSVAPFVKVASLCHMSRGDEIAIRSKPATAPAPANR